MSRPHRLLLGWTAVVLIPAILLGVLMVAPAAEGCFEYCDLYQRLAGIGFVLVGVVWLVGALVVARSWREREPSIAALSAIAVAPWLTIVAIRAFGLLPFDAVPDEVLLLAWVLGIGLQLPPVWRLTSRPVPSMPLRAIAAMQGAAVAVTAVVVVLGGSPIVVLAWFLFVLGLIPISLAAWRDGSESPTLVAPLFVACLPTLFVPVGLAAPGAIGYVIFLFLPLMAFAWLWIGFGWLRDGGSIAREGVGAVVAEPGD